MTDSEAIRRVPARRRYSRPVGPSILCVVFDTARADALEPYGAPVGASPAVAQLAGSGRALAPYATAPWTLPSHASMFTGLLPSAVGVGETGEEREDAAAALHAQAARMLPEVMRGAGYATAAVSTNVWVTPWTGFDVGFERFELTDTGRQGRIHAAGRRAGFNWAKEAVRAKVDDGAAAAERVLAGWIEELDADRPFFWFVNLMECHSPYLPPRPYNDLGAIDRLRAGVEARRHLTLDAIWRTCLGSLTVPVEAIERMRDLYAASIRYMDDWTARLLERLDSRGALEDTTVIVMSDHGENLGEDGLIAHSFSVDDRLLRVPVVVSGPGAGALPERMTSLGELPLLVASLAGLDRHPWSAEDLPDEGIAVAQLNPPLPRDHPRVDAVRSEWNLDEGAIDRLTSRFVAATDGRFKLVRGAGREVLYDLDADPLELAPNPPDAPGAPAGAEEAVPALRGAIENPAANPRAGAGESHRTEHPSEAETEAIEERMRLLGYL
jgi:arylsulfatase A-like enzyme